MRAAVCTKLCTKLCCGPVVMMWCVYFTFSFGFYVPAGDRTRGLETSCWPEHLTSRSVGLRRGCIAMDVYYMYVQCIYMVLASVEDERCRRKDVEGRM